MRVSLLNLNLIAEDAIGASVIHMARFFLSRDADVRLYLEHPPERAPEDIQRLCKVISLKDLLADREGHFSYSDLYIYHYPLRYGLLESIKGIDRGAVLFDYHGVTPPDLWGSSHDLDRLIQGAEGVSLAHHADLAIAHSEFTRQELAERYNLDPERIRILPLPVPLDRFQPGAKDEGLVRRYGLAGHRVLLFVGRMAGNKRIDLLIEALPHIQREAGEVKLLLIGDDRSSPAYVEVAEKAAALARDLGVAEDVVFTGRVDDLPSYYRLADAFVTASLHEGFGLPVIEAMACGVPAVVSHAGALPETVGEAGLTFTPGDTADLAEKAVTLLQDESLRQELIDRGLRRAQDYTLEQFEANLAAIVEDATQHVRPLASVQAPESQRASTTGPAGNLADRRSALEEKADVALRGYTVRSNKPLIGPLIAWVRRNLTSHLREPYLDPIVERQVAFNSQLVRYLGHLEGHLLHEVAELKQKQNEIAAQLDDFRSQQKVRQSRLETQYANLQTRLQGLETQLADLEHLLDDDLPELQARVQTLRKHLAEAPVDAWAKVERLWTLLDGAPEEGYGFSYYTCSERVGGDLEVERALYAPFVEVFAGCQQVLDLGCGQGVFLSLLQEHDIPAHGVDLDADMVEVCSAKGLEVVQDEALTYLESLPAQSVDGIFCAHLIEHLPKPRLVPFLDQCYTKLRPGGRLALITPNGGGLTILHATFYKDLTHQQPLHPEALRFLLEATGFRRIRDWTLSPIPQHDRLQRLSAPEDRNQNVQELVNQANENISRLNELLFGDLDYAIVGMKVDEG